MRADETSATRRRSGVLALLLAIAALAGAAFVAWRALAPRADLNVLLVTVDTLRPDHLGAYGYARATSPAVDALARESLVFRQAFSQAPETNPSLSSMMTSHYSHETKVYRNFHQLQAGAVTLAEVLKAHGFRTGAVVTNFSLRRGSGMEQGFDDYDDRMEDVATPKWEGIERIAPKATAAALDWLGKHRRERFFLWVHYMDPHAPYMPPPPYDAMFPVPEPGAGQAQPISLPFLEGGTGTGGIPLYAQLGTHTDPQYYVAQYDGEIRYFDDSFAKLLAWLREQGLLDRTLVVFAADHGEGMGEHGYYFNHPEFVFNGLIHVPLLVRLPGREPRHGDVTTRVALLDVAPTILEVLAIDRPAGMRGQSLLAPRERPIFAASYYPGLYATKTALIEGDRKLIVHGQQGMLYDVRSDFAETNNLLLGGDASEIARAKAMKAEIDAISAQDDLRLGPYVNWDILSDSVKKLKALGYVQ